MPKKNAKTKRPVVRRTSPTICSADAMMARMIASDIFDSGAFGSARPGRISFKIGKYGVDERDGGGLCERALADVIAFSIRKRFMPNHSRLGTTATKQHQKEEKHNAEG